MATIISSEERVPEARKARKDLERAHRDLRLLDFPYEAMHKDAKQALKKYYKMGLRPGSAYEGLLKCDLRTFYSYATPRTIASSTLVFSFLWNVAPGDSWGSHQKVEDFLAEHPSGLRDDEWERLASELGID